MERTFERVTKQEITRREPPATGYLELQHLEATFPTIHRDTPVFDGDGSRLGRHGRTVEHRGTPDLDRSLDVGVERPRPNVGSQGPYLVVHLANPLSPPYDPVPIRKFRSVSSMTTVLIDKGQSICLEKIQTLYYSFSSSLGEKVGQFSPVHIGWYGCGALECHGACIEAFVHADDGHTGPGLPGHNGPFDGGCAAVFRQE